MQLCPHLWHWQGCHLPPCPTNGHHSCPELSAQWAWEGQGRTGGRKCSHLPLLVLYGGPGGTGTVVFPAQQVLTFISSDMNVQNCQGASTQLLSGVVPANTPPSPWPHRHPVCLSVPLPALLPLHTCAYIHMHAHHTLTQIKVFSHSWPKDGDCGFSCTSESCWVLPNATYDVNYTMTPSVTHMMSVQVFLHPSYVPAHRCWQHPRWNKELTVCEACDEEFHCLLQSPELHLNISYRSQSYEKTQKCENMMFVSWLEKCRCGHCEKGGQG